MEEARDKVEDVEVSVIVQIDTILEDRWQGQLRLVWARAIDSLAL